jgi:invasin B
MSHIGITSSPVYQGATGRTEAFEKYGIAASHAAKTEALQRAGQAALADMLMVSQENEHDKPRGLPGRPQLYAPPPSANGGKQETDVDVFTLLMAMLSELFGEVDNNKLKNRLAMVQNIAVSKQQGLEKVSAEYTAAVEALAAAEEAVGTSQEQLERLRERVQHFQGLLDESEARLAGLDPDSPEYASELALRDQLKGTLAGHAQTFQKAGDAHLKLMAIANAAAKTVAVMTDVLLEAKLSGPAIKSVQEKALSSSAQALLNRLKIIELLGESAQNKEELNQELFLELQARLQEHMELESEKYLEEVRKAEALQKTMGCIGAIVGAILTVATIAAGVLTANPVLIAVGVIGAAVMISDAIVKETTGVSYMAEAMKPLTTVMQQAIKLFAEINTQLLMLAGVDEETAKEIGQIIGMIQGIVATLAAVALVAVVGVQVVGPLVSAVASKLASVVAQAAPAAVQALKQVASSVGNSLTQMLTQLRSFITHGADPVSLARYAANLEIAQVVTEAANVAVQGGLQVRSGMHQAQAAVHLADVRIRMAISEEISSYLTRLVEDYGKAMQDRTRQIEQVFADMQRSHAVNLHIVRHV